MQFFSSGSIGCGWSEMVNFTAVTTELLAYDEPTHTHRNRSVINKSIFHINNQMTASDPAGVSIKRTY